MALRICFLNLQEMNKMEGLRPAWAVKAIVVIVVTSILFRCVCGANHTVGGASGWDLRSNLQLWSSSTTFNVGDDLVFSYTPVHDVVEVNELGYDTCIISNAIATYDTGDTVISLTQPGTRYFVCGRLGHCQQGLKLQVQILAQQQNNNGTDDDHNNNGGDPDQRAGGGRRRRSPPPPRRSPPTPRHHSPPDFRPAYGPCQCSGAGEDSLGDLMHLYRGLVPLITLVILSFTRACLFFPFSHLLVFI